MHSLPATTECLTSEWLEAHQQGLSWSKSDKVMSLLPHYDFFSLFTAVLQATWCHSHFADEDSEAQDDRAVSCPWVLAGLVAELGFGPAVYRSEVDFA